MIAPDSSVLIAGSGTTHPHYDVARAELLGLERRGRLVAHTLAETFAVLTSSAFGEPAGRVLAYLAQFLGRPAIGLPPEDQPAAIRDLAAAGVVGGAVYDGLIALAAREAGAVLISLDARAARTYERCGVEFRILGGGG